MYAWLLFACIADEVGTVDAPTSGAFDALTYNVHGLPDVITGDDGAARMAGIAPLLPGYDLIGLQESFDAEHHASVTSACEHPVQLWSDEKVGTDRAYGSGLGLLADLERVDDTAVFYSQCNGIVDASSDCLASKGFQVLRVRLGGGDLDIYNTHHEAGGGEDDDAVRRVQVEEVLEHMETWSVGRAILFMGDTNLRPSDPPDALLLDVYAAAGLRDACTEVDCAEPDHIDRFFLRDGDALSLSAVAWSNEPDFFDANGVPLSDHPAIHVTIGWEAP